MMSEQVQVWLAIRRRHGADVAEETAAAAQQVADVAVSLGDAAQRLEKLAAAAADSAHALARLSRAHENVLLLHQPDERNRCREDGQPWPCRTMRSSAAALAAGHPVFTGPSPDGADDIATQELPAVSIHAAPHDALRTTATQTFLRHVPDTTAADHRCQACAERWPCRHVRLADTNLQFLGP